MVGRIGFEPATFCTLSTMSLPKDFLEFQVVDLQRAETTVNDKECYICKFFNELELNPIVVRVEDIRHYLGNLEVCREMFWGLHYSSDALRMVLLRNRRPWR